MSRRIQGLFLGALVIVALGAIAPARSEVVINEVDYDQPGTDAAEFIELLNLGPGIANLSQYRVELVNGLDGMIYLTIDLTGALAPGACYVICGTGSPVPNCDLVVAPTSNFIQNGSPDAIGLRHNGVLVDAVSYEGDSPAPYTEGSGTGLVDDGTTPNVAIARTPDGTDTNSNNLDFTARATTPGSPCVVPKVVINEVDYDQPGTDTAEFIELLNVGSVAVSLAGYRIELVNGLDGVVYQAIDLPATVLPPGGCFVICGSASAVPNCNLEVAPPGNWIQNGSPDAIGLRRNSVLVDAVSYEGDAPAPYTEGSGAGLIDDGTSAGIGISRTPDGTDTDVNNVDFTTQPVTPAGSCIRVEVPSRPRARTEGRVIAAPNPFSPRTSFAFATLATAHVELDVHDLSGRLVRRLLSEAMSPGPHHVEWDGTDDAGRRLAAGAYLYSLRLDGRRIGARKIVILQ